MNDLPLPGTEHFEGGKDMAAVMVAGIDGYLDRFIEQTKAERRSRLHDRFAHAGAREEERHRFIRIMGLTDSRTPPNMEIATPADLSFLPPGFVHETAGYTIYPVRWQVFPTVEAEGLLLAPHTDPIADVVALPDCDRSPETLAGLASDVSDVPVAHRLAASGCRVVVPVLIDRADTYSGIPGIRMTNQPHREFIHRAAFEAGCYMTGFEVQTVLAVVDWFVSGNAKRPIGVTGYGEGGLVAFYAGAADTRIAVTAVSGYFQPRETLYQEPIYRNVFGLLKTFGDAEIACLVAPRRLIIEACQHPDAPPPPSVRENRSGAAPGGIFTPALNEVRTEFERACETVAEANQPAPFTLIVSQDGHGPPYCSPTLSAFLDALAPGVVLQNPVLPDTEKWSVDIKTRHRRQFERWLGHTQEAMRNAEFRRAGFWENADRSSLEAHRDSCHDYRRYLWDEILGRLPESDLPLCPKTSKLYETDTLTGYEVRLDVYDTVFAYGILVVPRGIPSGERRPVVVCQHGLEGRPQDVAHPEVDHPAYHRFACRLAEKGYVTYAPQNPYIGGNTFRQLLRKAHPVGQTLYGFIVRQHERTLQWLSGLSFVDPQRIAFYGLSYGGKTAMRIPAVLENYCLSICSADYNEWIWKNMSARHGYSYMITGEYDMPEYDLANTFNYAELSWLICPRPFMVERGHDDGVAPDEWVAYEYAKTRLLYDKLGIGDRTTIEVFDGPHTINGVGTFEFLERHLPI